GGVEGGLQFLAGEAVGLGFPEQVRLGRVLGVVGRLGDGGLVLLGPDPVEVVDEHVLLIPVRDRRRRPGFRGLRFGFQLLGHLALLRDRSTGRSVPFGQRWSARVLQWWWSARSGRRASSISGRTAALSA